MNETCVTCMTEDVRTLRLLWLIVRKWRNGSEEGVPGVLFFHVALVAVRTRPTTQITLYFAMCVSALKSKRMDRSRGNLAFTSNGFKNWKDATISFKIHEASASHKEALQVVMVL